MIHPATRLSWLTCFLLAALLLFSPEKLPGAPGDENWEVPVFAPPLSFGIGWRLASFKGDLCTAGYFWKAGNVWTTNIARWNGTNWQSVLPLLDSTPYAIAASKTDLFLAGRWRLAGRTNDVSLLRWDGTNYTVFEQIPSGIGAAAVVGPDLFVGGWFTNIAGVEARYVARWDGTNWFPLGNGVDGASYAMTSGGHELFVGGSFLSAGGIAATNVARWDGTNWSSLGAGVGELYGGLISAMLATNKQLYVAGNFLTAGGKSITNLARWDGTNWWSMQVDFASSIKALAFKDGKLYAAGRFYSIGGVRATNIAQWNGSIWAPVGGGLLGEEVDALAVHNGRLYASGSFNRSGSRRVNSMAQWDGTNWAGLGQGLIWSGGYGGLTVAGNKVYLGGSFFNIDGVVASNVACWNGTNWSALRQGADDYVNALVTLSNQVYIGGNFLNVDGFSAPHVARWNGSNWFALGGGVSFNVQALTVFSNRVIAGGSVPGATATNPVAQWNGATWTRLASANGRVIVHRVDTLVANSNRLFAIADVADMGTNFHAVVQWNGNNWARLGSFFDSDALQALAVDQNVLYAAGYFDAGDGFRYAVAQWTGTNWLFNAPAGDLYSVGIRSMAVLGGDIYLGGGFSFESSVGGQVQSSGIAQWDGLEWSIPGSGASPLVLRMLAHHTNIYLTGIFGMAGGRQAQGFAIWHVLPPRPELRISRRIEAVRVDWPNVLTNYVLHTRTNLETADWQPAQQVPVSAGSRNVVTNSATNGTRFFRLKVR